MVTNDSIVVPDKMLEGMGVNVVRGEVTSVDRQGRKVITADNQNIAYDKLYLATGASSFVPPIEGKDLKGVMTLRGLDYAAAIKEAIAGRRLCREISFHHRETCSRTTARSRRCAGETCC